MAPQYKDILVLKRDVFSETLSAQMQDGSGKVTIRRLGDLPLWSRPIARFLARREARALKAVEGVVGAPALVDADRDTLVRGWVEGTPLHLARPNDAAFYRDAKRLLREMRHKGVTHNDNAKPQNWLMTPDGRAALIDFQLASVHRRRGAIFHTMGREDLRHLLKQKRAFAPDLLTPTELRMLARKSLPSRVWMKTAKPVYNFVTRKLMHWSDGEGTHDRMDTDGPQIIAALDARSDVTAHFTCTSPRPGQGVDLYTFAETTTPAEQLRDALPGGLPDHLQCVAKLPRTTDGAIDAAILTYIAQNRLDEIESRLASDPSQSAILTPILENRLNLTDRR